MRTFAEERLNAAAYPECRHTFELFECSRCEADRFEPLVERHPGDTPGDFMGLLKLRCLRCGEWTVGLSITGVDSAPAEVKVEHPRCACGSADFSVALSERWEDWGFFDEGTVVARCTDCSRDVVLVDTD